MSAIARLLPEALRWRFFCLLANISDWFMRGQGGEYKRISITLPDSVHSESDSEYENIWFFCSTIGELNACKPVISKLCVGFKLVLITDRAGYESAFHTHFPDAVVVRITGAACTNAELISKYSPRAFYLAEIPIIPADAPCRLSYGLLRAVKRSGAPIYLVNGWLYGYSPSCRQDWIEREWFIGDYLDCFDVITVQTEEVKKSLIEFGAKSEKVHVTGNMKFDALSDVELTITDPASKKLIEDFESSSSDLIVAGCLSDRWEYELLLDSFLSIRKKLINVRLVLAPRHPENPLQLDILTQLTDQSPLHVVFKSKLTLESELDFDVMILDTIGELKSYYSASKISYVGRNHNILEPLSFGKPVIVLDGWERQYPSYPVYEAARDEGLLQETSEESLGSVLLNAVESDPNMDRHQILRKLEKLEGATERNSELLGIK